MSTTGPVPGIPNLPSIPCTRICDVSDSERPSEYFVREQRPSQPVRGCSSTSSIAKCNHILLHRNTLLIFTRVAGEHGSHRWWKRRGLGHGTGQKERGVIKLQKVPSMQELILESNTYRDTTGRVCIYLYIYNIHTHTQSGTTPGSYRNFFLPRCYGVAVSVGLTASI